MGWLDAVLDTPSCPYDDDVDDIQRDIYASIYEAAMPERAPRHFLFWIHLPYADFGISSFTSSCHPPDITLLKQMGRGLCGTVARHFCSTSL